MMASNTVWYHWPGAFSSLGTRVLPTEPSVLLVQIATPWKGTNNVIVLCKLSQVFRVSGNVLGPPKFAVLIVRMTDLRETFFYCILGNYFLFGVVYPSGISIMLMSEHCSSIFYMSFYLLLF